jgi:hypothetical protein
MAAEMGPSAEALTQGAVVLFEVKDACVALW